MRKIILIITSLIMVAALAACQGRPDEPVTGMPDQPEPGQSGKESPTPPTGYLHGNVYINEAQLMVMESYPVQVSLHLKGELPTPCNELQVDIADPDAELNIYVDVYTLVDPEVICVQMTEPFEESFPIPMQGKADGHYRVYVNGDLAGEFSYPG